MPKKGAAKKASSKGPKKEKRAPVSVTCTAKKRNGKPCGLPPIKGGTVCHKHGGSAPQVRAKANERLRAMVLPALAELRKIIDSPAATDADKLRAIQMVLQRTGYHEHHSIDIGLREPRPWDNLGASAFQIARGEDAVDWDDGHELGQSHSDDVEHYNLESRRNANRELEERDTYLADLDNSDIVVGRVVKEDPAYPPGPIDHERLDRQRSNRPSEFDPYPQGDAPHRDGTRAYEREEGP